MDNKFYQDDELEQFLQDEVKQHRMYPSDHIWKNIRMELHGYKAWPALTFISLFIITALTITTLLNNHPGKHLIVVAATNTLQEDNTATANVSKQDAQPVVANDYFEKIAPSKLTAETFAKLEETPDINIVTRNNSIDYTAVPVKTFIANDHNSYTDKIYHAPVSNVINPSNLQNTIVASNTAITSEENTTGTAIAAPAQESISEQPAADQQLKKDYHPSADEFLKDFDYVRSTPKPRNSKFGFQFYVTPSQSYRRLSDEKVKEVIQPATNAAPSSGLRIPLSSNYSADVNDVVRHKPAMGFEMGFAVLYNMNPRLKFKTGLQLNVRQYYIETFQTANDLASLSLINYSGVETISFYSPYNNNTGKKTQLDNKIYQLSVPVGVQWDMIQGKHVGITAEGSVHPTLTLNTNTYLLSTDYKHYTGGDNFIRKWNINTSVGINLTYKSGASSWQIGPQIRYQHLPTYSNLYPIKEYLIDYGVRLGFTRQIK